MMNTRTFSHVPLDGAERRLGNVLRGPPDLVPVEFQPCGGTGGAVLGHEIGNRRLVKSLFNGGAVVWHGGDICRVVWGIESKFYYLFN